MKKTLALLVILFAQCSLAVDQNTSSSHPLPSFQDTQEPAQQFVTSDSETAIPVAPPSHARPPTTLSTTPPIPSTPATLNNVAPAPETTLALGANASDQVTENVFAQGLDIPMFLRCKQTSRTMCQMTRSVPDFQECLKKIKVPACKQFFAFASLTGMGPKDDIDVVKQYPDGGLNLVHLVRFGANYPGVYYSIGSNGDFIDLIFGSQTQKIDIRKDIHYPEIASTFPNVELFSIVEKMPEVQANPGGTGVRLVFRFQLLNGCHACERAGYANIAYDFSETGRLQNLSIVSLEPAN